MTESITVNKMKRTMEEKTTMVAEERSQHLREMSARMEWIRQRLVHAAYCTSGRSIGECQKEV